MNIVKERRAGFIKISRTLINEEPEPVLAILSQILIVEVDQEFISDVVIYRGYSQHFDAIEEGQIVPGYEAWVKIEEGPEGQTIVTSVKFKKVIERNNIDVILKDLGNVRPIQEENN